MDVRIDEGRPDILAGRVDNVRRAVAADRRLRGDMPAGDHDIALLAGV
jgi:hypothetical protein